MIARSHKQKKQRILIYSLVFLVFISVLFIWNSEVQSPISADPQGSSPGEKAQKVQTSLVITPAKEDQPVAQKEETKQATEIAIPILMYHYIRVVEDPNDKLGINLSVTPERFAKQLDYLVAKGYKTINFNDIEKGNIPDKAVILTFDDGYTDFYTKAYPELKKREMTAVSFVIAGRESSEYMTASEIRELSDNNIEIGSHTMTHPDLSTLARNQATGEITNSKSRLETITGKKVISFCYPAGKFSAETQELVKSAGYHYATTTKIALGQLKSPLILSRYRMNADTSIDSYLK